MLAGQLRGVPVVGTLAHSFVTSFSGTEVPPDPVSTPLQLHPRGQTPRPALAWGRGGPGLGSHALGRQSSAAQGSWQAGGLTPARTATWGEPGPTLHSGSLILRRPLALDVGPGCWSGPQGGPGRRCGGVAGARLYLHGAGGAGPAPGGAGGLCGLCPGLSSGLPGPAGHLQCAEVRPGHHLGGSAQQPQPPDPLVSARRSGLPNFLAVALALGELGYHAVGVRLDSGDLLRQAQEIRGLFRTTAAQ